MACRYVPAFRVASLSSEAVNSPERATADGDKDCRNALCDECSITVAVECGLIALRPLHNPSLPFRLR